MISYRLVWWRMRSILRWWWYRIAFFRRHQVIVMPLRDDE